MSDETDGWARHQERGPGRHCSPWSRPAALVGLVSNLLAGWRHEHLLPGTRRGLIKGIKAAQQTRAAARRRRRLGAWTDAALSQSEEAAPAA